MGRLVSCSIKALDNSIKKSARDKEILFSLISPS